MNTDLWVDGKAVAGVGEIISVINPANEQVIVGVASASFEQLEQTILAAKHAFKDWQHTSDQAIHDCFYQIADTIEKTKDDSEDEDTIDDDYEKILEVKEEFVKNKKKTG